MTSNTKKAVPKDLIDSLLADYKKPAPQVMKPKITQIQPSRMQ